MDWDELEQGGKMIKTGLYAGMAIICILTFLAVPSLLLQSFAQTVSSLQIQSTNGGSIDIGFAISPVSPTPGGSTNLLISFINKSTHAVQQHIDYKVAVTEGSNQICGTSVEHTAEGSVSVPCQLPDAATYQVVVEVDGILFQPIPPEAAAFIVTYDGGSYTVSPSSPPPYTPPWAPFENATIKLTTDKPSYNYDDAINITGTTNIWLSDNIISIIITDPVGKQFEVGQTSEGSGANANTFSLTTHARGIEWESAGTYTVLAQTNIPKVDATTTFQFIGSSISSHMPIQTPASTSQQSSAVGNVSSGMTIAMQQYKQGFGSGSAPVLVAPPNQRPYITTDGMLVEANRIYSLKFPNWNYTFDSRGPEYGMMIVYDVKNPSFSSMTLQSYPNVISSSNEMASALQMAGLGSLQSLYSYYDSKGGNGTTIGAMILGSAFMELENDYGISSYNSNITNVKFLALRFDQVNYVPSFQIESSYTDEQNQIQYHELDTYYILGQLHMRLTCSAQIDQYDKFYPYFIHAANSLVINPDVRANQGLEDRLVSDFDAFKTNGLLDNMTKTWPDMKIEYNFSSHLNETDASLLIQTPENTTNTMKIPSWIKNNAKWWYEGSIGDDDFEKGIQYLISQKIIKVPQTQQATQTTQQIPSWVKNLAGMWTNGKVSDDDFLKGIEYLVKIGIITV